MAAGQQKKRLDAAGVMSYKQQKTKKKKLELAHGIFNSSSHISLEWDNIQKKAVAKKGQIGIAWRDLAPFIGSVTNCWSSLVDVIAIPEEVFELENITGVLSYEVWETHLSETERSTLSQFLPRGTDAQQAVIALLTGENLHFGNPFLKWGSSLCSGNLHPDVILHKEHSFNANKKAYYSELQKYHNDIVDVLKKWKKIWASCKDPEMEILQKMWRPSRKNDENSLSSHANDSRPWDMEDNLAATAESYSWIADEMVNTSNKQNISIVKSSEPQRRKGLIKIKHGNTVDTTEQPKEAECSKTEDKSHRRCIRSSDVTKYMSYIKISRKQHQLVKSMKQSGDGIQSKSLNRVLGNIKSFHVQPYKAYVEAEQKKLQEHWLKVANRDLPAAYADWQRSKLQRHQLREALKQEMAEKMKLLEDKDVEREKPDGVLQEQRDNGEDHESFNIKSYADEKESGPNSPPVQLLQRIPSLNGHHKIDSMDMDSDDDNQVVLKPDGAAPNLLEYLGNMNPTEDPVKQAVPASSTKDVWPAVSMPDSYYSLTSVSPGDTSASELSLRQPPPIEERPAHLIDLESDILEEDIGDDLLCRQSSDVRPALHIDNSVSSFSSYTNQDRSELLQPFFKGQRMLPSFTHEQKQVGLQFLPTDNGSLESTQLSGHFREQHQQLLDQRQMRERELYMHQIIEKHMYPNGGRYTIQNEKPFLSSVNEQDWAFDPVQVSAPLRCPTDGGLLLGQHWLPGDYRARGGWSGMESTASPGQCLGNGSIADESLFSVLSQYNKLQSSPSYDSMHVTEHFIPARSFMGGGMSGVGDVFPQIAHPHYMKEPEVASAALKVNSMPWVNMSNHNSSVHESMGKSLSRSWNQ